MKKNSQNAPAADSLPVYFPVRLLILILPCILAACLSACARKGSTEYPVYSHNVGKPLQFDTYCSYGEPYLKELRDTYDLEGLTAGCETEFEKVQVITEWVTNLWDHNGANIPPKGDPLSILHDVTKEGAQYRCVEYGTVIFGCLNALDIPARTLGLKTADVETRELGAGHVATEVYLKDYEKWVLIDGQWGTIPMSGDLPLNAVELCEALWQTDNSQYSHAPVEFLSFRDEGSDGYAEWIREYLYYMNVSFYTKKGKNLQRYDMMLLPEGAKIPKVFQIKYPLKADEYTHSVIRFYSLPEGWSM